MGFTRRRRDSSVGVVFSMGWTVRLSNPGEGEIFRTHQDCPRSSPFLLWVGYRISFLGINPLNAELNPIRHLLALVGARHIVHVSRVRVKQAGCGVALTIHPIPAQNLKKE